MEVVKRFVFTYRYRNLSSAGIRLSLVHLCVCVCVCVRGRVCVLCVSGCVCVCVCCSLPSCVSVDDDVSQACPYVYVNHTGHIRYDRMLRLVSACNLEIF